ncbi:hypothetical protein FHS29_000995 [Saccharothrix tamanrassetensis]|uniref:Uncharacterized protein n=1 Tax=Saccharothrix tamanrassetensis TaxID=1051531 RepID=A0A841CEI1_9PSEU|nr:hypothetical protein [Saccharothrix tamanrassetensis]MBB5954425.1 hypothetical protein [Saccharothrix tamanrassetensis]
MADRRRPWRDGGDSRERVLADLVADALADRKVRSALGPADLTAEDLVEAVHESQASVFAAAADLEDTYRRKAVPMSPGATRSLNRTFAAWFGGFPLVLAFVLLAALASTLGLVDSSLDLDSVRPMVALVSALFVVVVVAGVPLGKLSWGMGAVLVPIPLAAIPAAILSSSWALAVAAVVAVVIALVTSGFTSWILFTLASDSSREATDAFQAWLDVLRRDGVLPVLYARINEATEAVYSTTLSVREASALRSADRLRMHVPTPAGVELTRLVAQLGGGSFAVAGARGAGKTDLLRAFCAGRYREPDRLPDLAVLVSAPVDYVPQEFVLHLFAETCQAVIGHLSAAEPVRGVSRLRRKVAPPRLVAAARENLVLLNYVRSHTDEIAGKGGFKGFELSGKRAVTLAGRPLNHPELVKRFREFLALAVAESAARGERAGQPPGRVIIAIDELDRIGVGDPARRFLNEIKAVFDVAGCHYLVSVSTEAQHDFELSGLGLRSVFDSSFDEVVRVDYLDFEYARKLLRRYVLGLSEQFLALAYVLSGGLARQLVRVTRAIVDAGRGQPGRSIEEVVRAIVQAELTRACQTTADALATVDDRDGVTALLRLLDERPTEPRGYGERVLHTYDGHSEQVRRLRDAVGVRVCFLETVRDIFTDDLDERRTREIDFDLIARARRYVGSNPVAGLGLLNDIRTTRGLDPIALR